MTSKACPLCSAEVAGVFFHERGRDYFRCPSCGLIYLSSENRLPSEEERDRYRLHQNSPEDKQYRAFLNRLYAPLIERMPAGSRGLDFGSGPGPTLSVMFEEAGHSMELFDVFFANDPSVFNKQYDFITATEVLEHLHRPIEELERLWGCLKPGGWLGVMTKLARGREDFQKWHYKNDPTHICFFSRPTFNWLAGKWGADLTFTGDDVVLFHKQNSG